MLLCNVLLCNVFTCMEYVTFADTPSFHEHMITPQQSAGRGYYVIHSGLFMTVYVGVEKNYLFCLSHLVLFKPQNFRSRISMSVWMRPCATTTRAASNLSSRTWSYCYLGFTIYPSFMCVLTAVSSSRFSRWAVLHTYCVVARKFWWAVYHALCILHQCICRKLVSRHTSIKHALDNACTWQLVSCTHWQTYNQLVGQVWSWWSFSSTTRNKTILDVSDSRFFHFPDSVPDREI